MDKVEIAQVGKRNCSYWYQRSKLKICLVLVNTIVHLEIINAIVFAHEWSLGEILLTNETYSFSREQTGQVGVLWPCQSRMRVGCLQVYP